MPRTSEHKKSRPAKGKARAAKLDDTVWRKTASAFHFGLFVRGKYVGEVTMLGDNSGHARTRFLEQAMDHKREFVTLVPRKEKLTQTQLLEEVNATPIDETGSAE